MHTGPTAQMCPRNFGTPPPSPCNTRGAAHHQSPRERGREREHPAGFNAFMLTCGPLHNYLYIGLHVSIDMQTGEKTVSRTPPPTQRAFSTRYRSERCVLSRPAPDVQDAPDVGSQGLRVPGLQHFRTPRVLMELCCAVRCCAVLCCAVPSLFTHTRRCWRW